MKIGLVSISDRASQGIYSDEGIPALKNWLSKAILSDVKFIEKLIPDEQKVIENTLIELVDEDDCSLVFTTGGTGPSIRDVTPEATQNIGDKELPGFGELMRQISLYYVPTAILSRQTAVIRKQSLIINLPGRPKAIEETLGGVKNSLNEVVVQGIFASIPYCLDIIKAPYLEINEEFTSVFRPKK